jgi:hypothetical protein
MHFRRNASALVILLFVSVAPVFAASNVPFKGHWAGSTVSAIPTEEEGVLLVTTTGTGNLTHLGKMEMTSPHLTYLATFRIEGTQIFTAANGDEVHATIEGQLTPNPDGTVSGAIPAVITGGTGRFANATGTYTFNIVATPGPTGFDSTATFDGVINY